MFTQEGLYAYQLVYWWDTPTDLGNIFGFPSLGVSGHRKACYAHDLMIYQNEIYTIRKPFKIHTNAFQSSFIW